MFAEYQNQTATYLARDSFHNAVSFFRFFRGAVSGSASAIVSEAAALLLALTALSGFGTLVGLVVGAAGDSPVGARNCAAAACALRSLCMHTSVVEEAAGKLERRGDEELHVVAARKSVLKFLSQCIQAAYKVLKRTFMHSVQSVSHS